MILAEIILDKRYKTKKGYPVKIRVYDNTSKLKGSKNRTYLNLNIYQESEELKLTTEVKRKEIELSERVKYCNDNLLLLDDAERIILEGIPENDIDIEIQVLETKIELLKMKKGIQKSVGLIEFGNQLIQERKAFKRPVLSYENTLKRISKFIFPEMDIPLNAINKEWIILLDIYLKNEKLTDNSIKSYISIVRAIYKEAQTRESLLIKKENPFLKLRTFAQNKVVIDLTIDDLRKMRNLKTEDIHTKSYLGQLGVKQLADLYLFQFAIGGHDMIDIANLQWSNIVNGRVKFKRYKNRFKKSAGEEVDNKLNEFALSILEKYGDKSSSRIFTFLHCPNT